MHHSIIVFQSHEHVPTSSYLRASAIASKGHYFTGQLKFRLLQGHKGNGKDQHNLFLT